MSFQTLTGLVNNNFITIHIVNTVNMYYKYTDLEELQMHAESFKVVQDIMKHRNWEYKKLKL